MFKRKKLECLIDVQSYVYDLTQRIEEPTSMTRVMSSINSFATLSKCKALTQLFSGLLVDRSFSNEEAKLSLLIYHDSLNRRYADIGEFNQCLRETLSNINEFIEKKDLLLKASWVPSVCLLISSMMELFGVVTVGVYIVAVLSAASYPVLMYLLNKNQALLLSKLSVK